MKILIMGSSGQLGHDLTQQARSRHWEVIGADLPACDITDTRCVADTLANEGQGVAAVINAAAYTAVDAAESNCDPAYAVNRDGVGILASVCRHNNIPLIHVSTDYVFDGLKTSPYLPTDSIHPCGVYGRSKAEGEALLRRQWDRHIIVRTSWLFGLHGGNFVKTMLRLGRIQETLRVIDDQVGCPTYAGDLAGALLDIAAHVEQHAEGWGTYHFCNQGPVTWYAFTRQILALARNYETLAVTDIIPILTTEYPLPAPRPPYSVLDCGSLETYFNISRRHWDSALQEMLAQLYHK